MWAMAHETSCHIKPVCHIVTRIIELLKSKLTKLMFLLDLGLLFSNLPLYLQFQGECRRDIHFFFELAKYAPLILKAVCL